VKEETTTRANTSDSVSAILPFLEVLREAILLVSKDGEILAANRGATDILGLSVEQLNGRSFNELTTHSCDEIDRHLKAWASARSAVPRLLAWRTIEGGVIDCRCDGVLIQPKTRACEAVILLRSAPKASSHTKSLALDKEIEALRTSEKWFHTLMQDSSDMIVILEANGTARYVSPAIERMLGFHHEEQVGANIFCLVHPAGRERALSIFAQALKIPGLHPPIAFIMQHKDGSWRYLEHRINNMLDDPAVGE
jgi:PAS domain S-box-containing protein